MPDDKVWYLWYTVRCVPGLRCLGDFKPTRDEWRAWGEYRSDDTSRYAGRFVFLVASNNEGRETLAHSA